ncbi:MAG TPA: hypothetical protein VK083_11360 [Nocardia sp.]|uniref:hypothetical protein n=1 Tax=Nocardia sp. TaxID=1821 RepID=UPI002B4B5C0D|nr:hypothetical protein [Nocardia sp.]HLS77378.1 hypothetical protein [Nocardia sp.]
MTALNSRLMVTVAAFAAGAALALSGCSAGQISQTAEQAAAVNGNHADVENISLRNVHIVYPGEGYTNVAGGKALLALSIVNHSGEVADELTSVTTDLGKVTITPAEGEKTLKVGPQQIVTSGPAGSTTAAGDHGEEGHDGSATPAEQGSEGPDAAAPARIEITGLTQDIKPGLTYTVSFNFKENGTVQVQVPVDAGHTTERQVSELSGPAPEGAGGGH